MDDGGPLYIPMLEAESLVLIGEISHLLLYIANHSYSQTLHSESSTLAIDATSFIKTMTKMIVTALWRYFSIRELPVFPNMYNSSF